MALKQRFDDTSGVSHPNAHWATTSIEINLQTRKARITIACWHNKAAMLAKKSPLIERQVMIRPDNFNKYFGKLKDGTKKSLAEGYLAAKQIKSILVDSNNPDKTKWKYESPFKGAVDDPEEVPDAV